MEGNITRFPCISWWDAIFSVFFFLSRPRAWGFLREWQRHAQGKREEEVQTGVLITFVTLSLFVYGENIPFLHVHHLLDLWQENRQMTRGQAGFFCYSLPPFFVRGPTSPRLSESAWWKSWLKYGPYASHNLNMDKVQSNYGGANHRHGDGIEKNHLQSSLRLLLSLSRSAVRTSLLSPSKVTLFPHTQARACSRQQGEQSERFPPEVTLSKTEWHSWKKELTMEPQEGKIHRKETKESHNPGRRYWQMHSYRIDGATAGPMCFRMDVEPGWLWMISGQMCVTNKHAH